MGLQRCIVFRVSQIGGFIMNSFSSTNICRVLVTLPELSYRACSIRTGQIFCNHFKKETEPIFFEAQAQVYFVFSCRSSAKSSLNLPTGVTKVRFYRFYVDRCQISKMLQILVSESQPKYIPFQDFLTLFISSFNNI